MGGSVVNGRMQELSGARGGGMLDVRGLISSLGLGPMVKDLQRCMIFSQRSDFDAVQVSALIESIEQLDPEALLYNANQEARHHIRDTH